MKGLMRRANNMLGSEQVCELGDPTLFGIRTPLALGLLAAVRQNDVE